MPRTINGNADNKFLGAVARTKAIISLCLGTRLAFGLCFVGRDKAIGCDADGVPDFRGPMAGNSPTTTAHFDLLSVGGKDVRHEPLEERRARLEGLLAGVDE